MGNQLSDAIKTEKLSWVKPHSLDQNIELVIHMTPLLSKFKMGELLHLMRRSCNVMGIAYDHFYVTNGVWTLEFGGGEFTNNKVEVHCRAMPQGAEYEVSLIFAERHLKRMKEVIGAENYSLALRNCEHVARYVAFGAWRCLQMVVDAPLHNLFKAHLVGDFAKLSNRAPQVLQPTLAVQALYAGKPARVKITQNHKEVMGPADEKNFNVVVIGPTGCGKSTLINRLFNATVCETGGSAESVTTQINIYEGRGKVMGKDRIINVIDTVGFCDSTMDWKQCVRLIQDFLKVQGTTIDVFITVVSGRIEKLHADSIKQMLQWLQFEKYKDNFLFIYNKADLAPDELENNRSIMVGKLGTGNHSVMSIVAGPNQEVGAFWLNFPLGIPPGASHDEQEAKMTYLYNMMFTAPKRSRVPVHASQCNIL